VTALGAACTRLLDRITQTLSLLPFGVRWVAKQLILYATIVLFVCCLLFFCFMFIISAFRLLILNLLVFSLFFVSVVGPPHARTRRCRRVHAL
jgi:hypothetical protein